MLCLLQKNLKTSKVCIYVIFSTQRKCVLKINAAPKDIMRFGAKFFVSPTCRETKTSTTNDN